jgi:GcrA cell cycle regulator
VWPQGEPEDNAFRWCGERVEPGRPYCPQHVERAIERKDEAKAA